MVPKKPKARAKEPPKPKAELDPPEHDHPHDHDLPEHAHQLPAHGHPELRGQLVGVVRALLVAFEAGTMNTHQREAIHAARVTIGDAHSHLDDD